MQALDKKTADEFVRRVVFQMVNGGCVVGLFSLAKNNASPVVKAVRPAVISFMMLAPV